MVTKVQKWQCIPKFDKTAYDFGQNVSKIPRVFPDHGLPELQLFSALTSHVIQGVSRHWTPRTELGDRIVVHHGAVLHIIMPPQSKLGKTPWTLKAEQQFSSKHHVTMAPSLSCRACRRTSWACWSWSRRWRGRRAAPSGGDHGGGVVGQQDGAGALLGPGRHTLHRTSCTGQESRETGAGLPAENLSILPF